VDVFASFFKVLNSINVRRGSEDRPRSGLSLALWLALWGVTFLGRVCGGLELLRGQLVLRGQRL
jgi:hypothetical protein